MPPVNPYEAPAAGLSDCDIAEYQHRQRMILLGIVLASGTLNLVRAIRLIRLLSLGQQLASGALWIVLPLVAVVLPWQRVSFVRWALFALFAFRAVGMLLSFVPIVLRQPAMAIQTTIAWGLFDAAFYSLAALWLAFLPTPLDSCQGNRVLASGLIIALVSGKERSSFEAFDFCAC